MNEEFTRISAEEIDQNIIKLIGKDWMLITAGSLDSYNTMTASWGQMGVMWSLPVYNLIAKNRYKFYEKESSCFIPNSKWKSRFLD